MTRRIVMFNRFSADGYFAGTDGSLDWIVPDAGVDAAGAAAIPGNDTILLGRRTYEMFASFWPHALDSATDASDPHDAGHRSPSMTAFANFINSATKLVFSRTLKSAKWQNSHLVRELEPRDIEAMKTKPGKNIIVLGSGSIVSQLAKHNLIDEYQFVISPTLLGAGRPLIAGGTNPLRVDLLDVKTFDSGNVMLRYVRRA